MKKELPGTYIEYEREVHIRRARQAIVYFAIPAVLIWTIVDRFYVPDIMMEFFFVRLLVIPAAIITLILFRQKNIISHDKLYTVPSFFMIFFIGVYSAYLCYRTGFEESIYYAGINLVAVALFGFVPWQPYQLFILPFLLYLPWGAMLFFKSSQLNMAILVPHTAFMASTATIGFGISLIMRAIRISDFKAKVRLDNELKTKEQVIARKTNEGIYLEKLASQFSPQVIDAIKNGKISIDAKVRSEISCIFIDIENSTDRSGKIDHNDYLDTITEFFNNCIEILLRHDITIGTYLGDGMLAFVNAPQKRENHPLVAIEACLDILREHDSKRKYYFEKWRRDFNVRIGINTGYSYVGFFPSYKRGTYTGMGDSVNLASRLCTRATANTICVSKTFMKRIVQSAPSVEIIKTERVNDLKGFESEQIEIFHLRHKNTISIPSADLCPMCKGNFTIEADLGVSLYLKCPSCGFIDLRDKIHKKKAA